MAGVDYLGSYFTLECYYYLTMYWSSPLRILATVIHFEMLRLSTMYVNVHCLPSPCL